MSIKKLWNLSNKAIAVVDDEKKVHRLKHGMLASIPLLCKKSCPFKATCRIEEDDRDYDGRCLVEIAALLQRFEDLCLHFEIDTKSEEIEPENVVDISLIKDIVDIEVQILRSENLIASSGNFMAEHISQVDKFGTPYYEEIIHPALEYKLKLLEQRNKVYTKLNATRKDKLAIAKTKGGYTEKALELIEKVKGMVDDLDLDDLDD